MKIIEKLTQKLVSNGTIKDEDRELYSYGFHQGIALLYNYATAVIIGLLYGMVWQSIIFMVAYGVIRPYAGGYHAKTPFRCYLFSAALMVISLGIIKFIPWSSFILFSTLLLSNVAIILLAPVEDENKPLDKLEIVVYRKRVRIILCLLTGISVVLWLLKTIMISICVCTALFVLAVMLLLGKIKTGRSDFD